MLTDQLVSQHRRSDNGPKSSQRRRRSIENSRYGAKTEGLCVNSVFAGRGGGSAFAVATTPLSVPFLASVCDPVQPSWAGVGVVSVGRSDAALWLFCAGLAPCVTERFERPEFAGYERAAKALAPNDIEWVTGDVTAENW